MSPHHPVRLTVTAFAAAIISIASARELLAQPCAPPTLEVVTGCPLGDLIATFTAASADYESAALRVYESGSMILIDEQLHGPIGLGDQFTLITSLANGDYEAHAEGECIGGGTVLELQSFTVSCSGVLLVTALEQPSPGVTSAASISVLQQGVRSASFIQSWSGPSFDVSGFALSTVQGTATLGGPPDLNLAMNLVVASSGASSATLACVVTSVSPSFVSLLGSLGAPNPVGATIGAITLSQGLPLGPQISVDVPDPFPIGSMWVPVPSLELSIEIDMPFVDLPPMPSIATVSSEVTMIDTSILSFVEDIFIDTPPVLYVPEINAQLSTTSAGATATITQTITDPTGSRLTVEAASVFSMGAFLLAGYAAGETVGEWRIDFTSLPQALSGQIVVSSAGSTLVEADLIADSIHPVALSLLASLGLPNPTGTAVYALDYENIGGGVLVRLHDHSVFPMGASVPVVQDLSLVLEHEVGLALPAAGGFLTIDSTLESQFGELAFRSQTIPISDGGGEFERGDCNSDNAYDIGDAIFTLTMLFSGGSPPLCADACDSNDDGSNDIGDAIYTLAALFAGGQLPGPPGTSCGPDPTLDSLGCIASPCP